MRALIFGIKNWNPKSEKEIGLSSPTSLTTQLAATSFCQQKGNERMISMAAANQGFFANVLSPLTHKPKPIFRNTFIVVSCKSSPKEDPNDAPRKTENQFAKLAIVTLTAGVLTLGSVQDAYAAKTSGRVGGQAFRSSAPRSSSPRINNSRTNIYVNPPVAPPLVGGYGFGFGSPYYGGWGWSPFSFFMPGPSVAVGVGGGFDLFVLFVVLGAVSAVVSKFRGRRDDYDDDY